MVTTIPDPLLTDAIENPTGFLLTMGYAPDLIQSWGEDYAVKVAQCIAEGLDRIANSYERERERADAVAAYLEKMAQEPGPGEFDEWRIGIAREFAQDAFVRSGIGNSYSPYVRPDKSTEYVRPEPRQDEYCPHAVYKVRRHSSGKPVKTARRCQSVNCTADLLHWQRGYQYRHDWETTGESVQTVVVVGNCYSDRQAADAAIGVGRTGKANRTVCVIPYMGTWQALIVFHAALDDADAANIKRTRLNHGQTCEIENRRFHGGDLLEWLPYRSETQSGLNPCRIETGRTGKTAEREYAYSDGKDAMPGDYRVAGLPNDFDVEREDYETRQHADQPGDTDAEKREKLDRRNVIHVERWFKGIELRRSALRELATDRAAGRPGNIWACLVNGIYRGPRSLMHDLARAIETGSDRQWVAAAMGHVVDDNRPAQPVSFLPSDFSDDY